MSLCNVCPCTYTMWVLMWRLWPAWATKLQDQSKDLTAKPASQHWCYSESQRPLFGLSQSMFVFNLDCTFQFMTVPVDGRYFVSFSGPLSWDHKFYYQYLLRVTEICCWKLKVSIFKQANSQSYQENWKTATTHTSCIKIWMLKCFECFFNKSCNHI
jgi:hypothetical protein